LLDLKKKGKPFVFLRKKSDEKITTAINKPGFF